jgi:hypothetical protein
MNKKRLKTLQSFVIVCNTKLLFNPTEKLRNYLAFLTIQYSDSIAVPNTENRKLYQFIYPELSLVLWIVHLGQLV